jgi:hypothetical protein
LHQCTRQRGTRHPRTVYKSFGKTDKKKFLRRRKCIVAIDSILVSEMLLQGNFGGKNSPLACTSAYFCWANKTRNNATTVLLRLQLLKRINASM